MLEQRDTDNLILVDASINIVGIGTNAHDPNISQIHFKDGTVYDLTIHQTYPQMKVYRVFIPHLRYFREGTVTVMARSEEEARDVVDQELELEPDEMIDPNRYQYRVICDVTMPHVLDIDRGGNRDD